MSEIRSGSGTTSEGEKSEREAQVRTFLPVPQGWDSLTEAEETEVSRQMAEALIRRLKAS